MRPMQWVGVSLTAIFVLLNGCGHSGGTTPTSLSYTTPTAVYTKGVAVIADSPTSSGGAVTGYSVSPALPAGLSLNTSTGVVSGTPTVVIAAASYTVTASGTSGSITAALSITVNDQPPSALSYAAGTAAYTVDVPITANFPTNSGGTVILYSVSSALPAGLSLSTATGTISGTPTAVITSTSYTVTAANSGGNASAALTIAVNAVPSAAISAPAGLAYHPGNAVYTVGVTIPENAPTSTGGPALTYINSFGALIPAYSISPSLPPGLNLSGSPVTLADNGTGVISGIPTGASPTTIYTVTASNSAGSTTANLTITVNNPGVSPSGLAYETPAPVYLAGMAITPDSPLTNLTIPTSSTYSASPGLPSGLSMDPSTGIVSGSPAAVPSTIVPPPPSTATTTVTVTSASGSTTAPLTITIYNAPQAIPNMAQSITPLEITGASFQYLDTGMVVTDSFDPKVAPREWLAGQAVSTSVSPDGNTLVVLTSGYNRVFQGPFPLFDPLYSSEYIFIFDITNNAPVFKQAIPIPNAYHGIVWDPLGQAFYVSGGMGDEPFGTDPIPNGKAKNGNPIVNNGDNVHIITQSGGSWAATAELDLGQDPRNLLTPTPSPLFPVVQGHPSGNGLPVPNNAFASVNAAVYVAPMAAGIGISGDGNFLVVANYFNDSVTIFQGGLSAWLNQWVLDVNNPAVPPLPYSAQGGRGTMEGTELDLRPGMAASGATHGTPGGEYPFWVVMAGSGNSERAYVSSLRDREIDVVSLFACVGYPPTYPPTCFYHPSVTARIPVKGQPNKMTKNKAETLLYVAEDETDTVDVIDINSQDAGSPGQTQPATVNTVIESIPVIAPPDQLASFALTQYTGANTNSVTLSRDETQLYVTNGNLNNIAVVQLNGTNHGDYAAGLIPTGWYPNSVSFSRDGSWAYVVNMKSPTGANPDECYAYGPTGYPTCMPSGEYNPQLTKAGLLSFPVAGATAQLSDLTKHVEANNRFAATSTTGPVIAAVRQGIQHVIYILKENRTYDQILGDLVRGNGDPALTLFGQAITPNQHNLAQQFVTLDNFLATAEVSYDGWPWSTSARAPDIIEHQYPVNYAQRGAALESEGVNRNVNVALPTLAQRQASDPLMPGGALSPNVTGGEDLLPGQTDVAAPDGPDNELNTGYLWDNALRAGLTVRDYGFFIDTTCYNEGSCQTPLAHNPFLTNTIVAPSTNVSLTPFTDPYFRGFDPAFPDYYRFKEWEREFDTNYAKGGLPNLTLVRFMHDHTGNFAQAIDGVNTPERDVADNDYAVGLLVQKIANSIYANNTLIFIVEDDAQDGGDHIDAHRTTAYVAGAYVKNGVVPTEYNTLDFVRTMEEVLGLQPMNLNDALATPMSDIFNTSPSAWSFTATPAAILYCTKLPLPGPTKPCNNPTPDARYWARVTKGMDFTDADLVDGESFNRILWKGMMGNRPYPSRPTGIDLRQNREQLLARYRRSLQQKAAKVSRPIGD